MVWNWPSEYGLSLQVYGPVSDRLMRSSSSSWATGFQVKGYPRALWITIWPGRMPWRSQVVSIKVRATLENSLSPRAYRTTNRLKASMMAKSA